MSKQKLTKKENFTYDEFLVTQMEILEAFEKKLNSLFIESVASKKKSGRQIILELMGSLRETVSWYIKINRGMLVKNNKKPTLN